MPLPSINRVRGRLALALAAGAVLLACGKRGDPLPPLRRTPLPVTDLKLAQRGDTLEISYVAPRTATDGARLPVLDVELLRLEGPGEFNKMAKREPRKTAPGEHVSLSEPLPAPGTELRFSAVAVSKGRSSTQAFVRSLKVQPAPPAASELSAKSSKQGVALAWTAPDPMPAWTQPSPAPSPSPTPAPTPQPSATPTPEPTPTPQPSPTPEPTPPPPPRAGGFSVYRRSKATLTYGHALTPVPIEAPLYEDTTAAADASYCYVVRTAVSSEPLVESDASNEACLDVLDVKAPEAPTGLATLADAEGIEISWSPSAEQDLALYRLYRGPARGGAREPLADVSPPSTSFKDVAARPGARYKYSLTALDKAGNESESSLPAEGGR